MTAGPKGLVIAGGYGELLAREKSGAAFELGELLIAEKNGEKTLVQVYDLFYGSQLPADQLELVSGMALEEEKRVEFLDPAMRNYTLAKLKNLITITKGEWKTSKSLPGFFSKLQEVKEEDISFITKPPHPLYLGNLRSGSKELSVPLHLDGEEGLSHHVLIAATTGRGKTNLVKNLLWKLAYEEYAGILVLDPHDEYYNDEPGLKDHPRREKIAYYSPTPLPGTERLVLNLKQVRPGHFNGAVEWSWPQHEALAAYYREHREEWLLALLEGDEKLEERFHESTMNVVRRRIQELLNIDSQGNCEGVFQWRAGNTTIKDIVRAITNGRIVVIDTSSFDGRQEVLIGSLITTELFRTYKRAKEQGTLAEKPVAAIILEEAPRVLNQEAIRQHQNVFSTIAREGRKFKVGLVAITQLPSLIPREILANMNTKVVLGLEMKPERQAIIESAAQDLSRDDRAIASLDRGEAIVTSTFAPFALPLKIPHFTRLVLEEKEKEREERGGRREGARRAYQGLRG